MATDHEETLQQRYLREHDEYVACIESMTTGQIMALDVQLADVTAQRDQLLAALEKMDRALALSNPEGAMGEVFELWNDARRMAGLPYLAKVAK